MKITSLPEAGRRMMILFLFSIGFFVISAFVMLGEDVYWKIAFVDLLYSNIGTNPNDAWTFVALLGLMLIWGIGLFWVIGVFDDFLNS